MLREHTLAWRLRASRDDQPPERASPRRQAFCSGSTGKWRVKRI